MDVQVDADSDVRSQVASVEIQVELQSGEGWKPDAERRFEPSFMSWPIRFRVGPERPDPKATYQLLATALDDHFGVVAQARTIMSFDRARREGLRAVFETACLEKLCGAGTTCSGGTCIDAESDAATRGRAATRMDATMTTTGMAPKPSQDGIAEEGAACSTDGERRCTSFASAKPLLCDGGMWMPQVECTSTQHCDTSNSSTRGECREIADECRGQQAGVRFCESDTMRSCDEDLLTSKMTPCRENERCQPDPNMGAICTCRAGFVAAKNGVGCEAAKNCDDNGGCDPLTTCRIEANARKCGDCPPGYNGSGESGCVPSLMTLTVKEGDITPAFNPGTADYSVHVPILTQRVSLQVHAPSESQVTINGAPATNDAPWTSDVLALGDNKLDVVVSSGIGMSRTYHVIVERGAEEQTLLKGSNTGDGANFGVSVSASGNTIVVGAGGESSGGAGINPPAGGSPLMYSGAVYVFVNRGGTWVQEAHIKADDAQAGDFFGLGATLVGDTLVVGATRVSIAQPIPGDRPGAVYVFTRSNGVWTQAAKLNSGQTNGDSFGSSVAYDGKTLVVGALLDGTLIAGSAFVFTGSGSSWTLVQKLTAPSQFRSMTFGASVAVSGDTVAVGAEDDQTEQYRGGAEYVFVLRNGRYAFQQRLTMETPVGNALFGFSTALQDDLLVVGATQLRSSGTAPGGEVNVFERAQDRWTRTAVLKNPLSSMGDSFGWTVGIGKGQAFIAVGATSEAGSGRGLMGDPASRGTSGSGAVYMFAKSGDGWKLSTYLKATNTSKDDAFGSSFAMTDDMFVVGAFNEGSSGKGVANPMATDENNPNSGAVYVYR